MRDPLQCWVPAQFTGNYETYTNRLCYIQNTYHVSKHHELPTEYNLRRERTLKYYQWINFVLLLQALFFSIPRILWQSFNDKIGLSLRNLVDASNKYELLDVDEERGAVVHYISDTLRRYQEYVEPMNDDLKLIHRFYRKIRIFFQARTGSSLVYFYFFIKILYIVNLLFQIYFLQYFLSYYDVKYIHYGLVVFEALLTGNPLPETKLFPRITLCDFNIRELGEIHHYTVECILVINIFIEKLYILLWFWFWILLVVTLIHFIIWFYRVFIFHLRKTFIKEHLELVLKNRRVNDNEFRNFVCKFSIDNLFALRVMAHNSNTIVVAEVLDDMYRQAFLISSDV
ncbi:unnamed protein product [Didymodactylos carnosus]|uniref:Innexin n=1 Tax=Didymodactylos carnosus TaxID=1234261 RepID=A0A815A5Q3_9BILA|nr:unnamed protein product [Didymodactylos carnosus]CAF4023316.1 unnamed protein product [Didymodactylos carnosus]